MTRDDGNRGVALTARAPDSKSGGWGFESLHPCHSMTDEVELGVERGQPGARRGCAAAVGRVREFVHEVLAGVSAGHLAEPPGAGQLHVVVRGHRRASLFLGAVDIVLARGRVDLSGGRKGICGERRRRDDEQAVVRRPHLLGLREQGRRGRPFPRQDLRDGREASRACWCPPRRSVEVRNKQKRETEQKFFPGYVLVEMELTDDTWHLVRSTPKVTGFVGSGNRPSPCETSRSTRSCADGGGRGEAQAQVGLPARRQGAGHRRAVRELPGCRRRHQPRARAHEGRWSPSSAATPVELEYYQVERLWRVTWGRSARAKRWRF